MPRSVRRSLGLWIATLLFASAASAQCLIDTPSQRAIWDRMKAENSPGYQQIRQNADVPRYNDIGRWPLLRYLVDHDPTYGRKSFEAVRVTTQTWTWIFVGNESREYMIEMAMMYGCLKPVLTPDEDAAFKGWLVAVANRAIASMIISDSDQTVGNYFGLAVLDRVAGTDYVNGIFWNAMTGEPQPVGGLDATGANTATLRNAVRLFAEKMGAGGNWIESTDYNLGTTWLLYAGATWAGLSHFPEVVTFAQQHAVQQMHELTPNLKDTFQWGDIEHPHELSLAVHQGDLWTAIAQMVTPTAPALGAAVRGFEDAVFAANSYTRNPLYARTYYWFDPYAQRDANWRTTAGNFLVTPGMGQVYWRDGTEAAMVQCPNWANGLVDHVGANHQCDLRLVLDGAFLLDHPLAYAPDPKFGNQVSVNGTGPSLESGGLLATQYEPTKYAYVAGTNAGVSPLISVGDYVNVPIYLHENTRQVVRLFGGPELVLIIADRVHAEDVYTQTIGTLGFDQFYTYPAQRETFAKRKGVKDWIFHTPVAPTLKSNGFTWNTVTVTRVFPADLTYSVVNESTDTTLGGYINADQRKFAVHGVPSVQRDFDLFLHVISTGDVQVGPVEQADKKGVVVTRGGRSQTVWFGTAPGPKLTLALKDNRVIYDTTKINAIAPYVRASIDGVDIPTPLNPVAAPAPDVDPPAQVPSPTTPPDPTPVPVPTNRCGYTMTPSTLTMPAAGGTQTFVSGPYLETCAAPVFVSGASSWMTVDGTIVTVSPNTLATERSAVIAVGSDIVGLVLQAGATAPVPVPEPTPVPDPTPVPVPAPKVCTDDQATYQVGQRLIKRTTRSKEAAFTLEMQSRGWFAELTNKVQKNNVDVTFRCVGI